MSENNLTTYELDCIRFYMGDPEIVNRGDFRGGPKAYNTINALLHDGIQNEMDKINEGKKIEIYDAKHLKSYMSLIATIYLAMEKYSRTNQNTRLITYRVDRFSEIAGLMEQKRIEGFYSTCKWGFLKEYANTKANIVLLEIVREKNVPYLDFECLFAEYYAKPQEAEILLPFDAGVKSIEKVTLTEEEKKTYRDVNGEEPRGKYRIFLEEEKVSLDTVDYKMNTCGIIEDEVIGRVQNCLKKLSEHRVLNKEEFQFYTDWKKKLKQYICKMIGGKCYAF